MSSSIAIRVENLGKRYRIGHLRKRHDTLRDLIASAFRRGDRRPSATEDTIWALKDVSFEVNQGEVIGIIGRNGAGKSTLLKILSRITDPTEGFAEIHGRCSSLLEVGTGFHPELTGRENIYLNGSILGMKRAEIAGKFDEIVAFAEVEKFMDTPVKHYSSGMYVRLAFAVAAHLQPDILLVDEVLAVGDITFRKKCLGKMQDISHGGRTVLFISHDMGAIRGLCQNAFWIDKGKIRLAGHACDVVGEYEQTQIRSSTNEPSFHERNEGDAKHLEFYISSVEMLDQEGRLANIFKYREKLGLVVSVDGHVPSDNYSVEFRIYSEAGDLVAMGASGAYHDIFFDKAIRRIQIEIGPLTLTNGHYLISLSLVAGTLRTDSWSNACSFHIVECQPFAHGRDLNDAVCVLQQSFQALE